MFLLLGAGEASPDPADLNFITLADSQYVYLLMEEWIM